MLSWIAAVCPTRPAALSSAGVALYLIVGLAASFTGGGVAIFKGAAVAFFYARLFVLTWTD